MPRRKHAILLGVLISLQSQNVCARSEKGEEPPNIGNFALPGSQQLSPLISFGQKVIGKDVTQFYGFVDDFEGVDKYRIDLLPNLVHGITENFAFSIVVPYAVRLKQDQNHSSGFEDTLLQFEYAFYNQKKSEHVDQATVVTGVSIPTGSSHKQPNTGIGAPSFFIGTTYSKMYIYWYTFTSYGALLTTPNGNTHFGNSFLYQAGLGRNLFTIDSRWLFAALLEADGLYSQKDTINGVQDPNSGGNIIYLTPSLWISSKKLILQFGAGIAPLEHLNGNQKRNNYLLAADIGWTF